MTTTAENVGLADLELRLRAILPQASLRRTCLPLVPEVSLRLINETYPQEQLDAATVYALMDEPPYWSFCWASGQVLARYLLDHPELVNDRTVLDLGPGSGVVAVAAAKAGARRVIACDLDPFALKATALNARDNDVTVELSDDLGSVLGQADLVLAADILYDRENLPLLARLRVAADVLMADSRVKDLQPPGYYRLGARSATTWPDLEESSEFNEVRLFSTVEALPEP